MKILRGKIYVNILLIKNFVKLEKNVKNVQNTEGPYP
jgi:hypothetical protein